MHDLKGKTVMVTGGARRLGRAIALAVAAAGADVAITFLRSAGDASATCIEAEAFGVKALALACDVREEESVRGALREIEYKMGKLDVLVNNAAVYESVAFKELTLKQWDNIFAVNARGPFLVSREACPMLRAQQGRIIHLGSLGAVRPWVSHGHYCASKAALHSLTEVMAKAFAPEIAVNCVAPGMIDLKAENSATMESFAARTPMQRNGEASDVVSAVMYFATAPKFVTGQTLFVDGGLSLT